MDLTKDSHTNRKQRFYFNLKLETPQVFNIIAIKIYVKIK